MQEPLQATHPPDICALLRIDGEQRWLIAKVIPLLRQLEQPGTTPVEEVGPALSYLEVLWLEAGLRASETDVAIALVDARGEGASAALGEKAARYHAAVRRLRRAVDLRVRALTCTAGEEGSLAHEHAAQETAGS
jgi:hypothetical protein